MPPEANADPEQVSRRRMQKRAAGSEGTAIGSGGITGFPTVWAQT